MKIRAAFSIEEKLLGIIMRTGRRGVERDGRAFEAANVEAVTVRHAKRSRRADCHARAPAENDLQTQKDFLSGFLSLRRTQGEDSR